MGAPFCSCTSSTPATPSSHDQRIVGYGEEVAEIGDGHRCPCSDDRSPNEMSRQKRYISLHFRALHPTVAGWIMFR